MVDTKVSSLTAILALDPTDELYIIQGGVSKKVDWSTIAAEIQSIYDSNSFDIRTENNPYLVAHGDEIIRCNGTFTVTLPPATGSKDAYVIKNVGVGVITVDANGAETIDGQSTQTLVSMDNILVIDVAAGVWDVY